MFKLGFGKSNFTRFGRLTINKLSWIKDISNKYLENPFKTEVIINSMSGPRFLDDETPFSSSAQM